MEVYPGSLNLGIGIPTFIPSIAAEEECSDMFTLISESGSIGGVPGAARDFGHHWNIESSTDQGDHFNYYDGVGVDIGIYGLGETDEEGNVNTSNLNGKIIGVGGFMNVTLNAKGAFFVGTFTAGGLKTKIEDGKLVILQEGKYKKFVKRVSQLTFNGNYARKIGQKVAFITERCVLILDPKGGLTLTEIAPGVDLEKDVLAHMDFKPVLPSGGPKLMDPAIFQPTWGGMKALMEKKAKEMGIKL
jgi:propionate CoA-transferase